MARKRLGFTLIELLIVVAIIAILAAIAVPNFLEAQIRSKVARCKTDMRSVTVAMESYFVDYNGYPRHSDFTNFLVTPLERQYHWFQPLTTPIAYISSMPIDSFQTPFSTQGPARTPWSGKWFHYDPINNTWDGIMGNDWGPWNGFVPEFRARGYWYVLWSPGPDGNHDFAGTDRPPGNNKGSAMACFYDPTNGTVSSGDIIWFGPGSGDAVRF